MSAPPADWTVVGLDEEALVARVEGTLAARQFAERLLASKAEARRVIARGQLLRENVPLAPQDELAPGDLVTLEFQRDEGESCAGSRTVLQAAHEPLDVLYRDAIMLAVDKPAGLLVHGDGTGADTLTDRVRSELAATGRGACAQPVQRLDVETTGVVLFSLTRELQPALDAQVSGHGMLKRYLAVVEGRVDASGDGWLVLDGPLARDRHDARRMRVGRTGKPSLTRVRTLDRQKGRSLLLVELGSGRRHQIRVHLAHEGHPIVGDALYGGKRCHDGLMLHAWGERLVHPATGEPVEFHTAWPARFASLFAEHAWTSA